MSEHEGNNELSDLHHCSAAASSAVLVGTKCVKFVSGLNNRTFELKLSAHPAASEVSKSEVSICFIVGKSVHEVTWIEAFWY